MNYWDKVMLNDKGYYFGDYDNPIRLLVLKLVKDGEWFLDLGCGNGMAYEMFMQNHRQIFYKGLDYSTETIKHIKDRWQGIQCFEEFDMRNLKDLPRENDPVKEYDTVYIRHCLETQEDWKETIRQAFRLAKKRVIIDMRKLVDTPTRLLEAKDDTFAWEINIDELNLLCRGLTVNVSYLCEENGKFLGDSNGFVVLGKEMDDVVFTLDDFHENNHHLDLLEDLKTRFPKLKVTLFTIPSMCSVGWLSKLKEKYGSWMQFAVHGWFHSTDRGSREADMWTKEDAHKYLKMAEDMGVFVKGFKPPGWCINYETYQVLSERGYWIMEHKDHDRWENEIKLPRLTTGHLWEVNGHIQTCNMNGLEELATTKCNFGENTNFHFVEEVIDDNNYLHKIYKEICP